MCALTRTLIHIFVLRKEFRVPSKREKVGEIKCFDLTPVFVLGEAEQGDIELLNCHSNKNMLFKHKSIIDLITLKIQF